MTDYFEARRQEARAAEAAEQAAALAARQAALPVIIDEPSAPAVVDAGQQVVTVDAPKSRPVAEPSPDLGSAVAPLSPPSVAAFLSEHQRYDPAGVAQLQREWGGDMAANLGYARSWLQNHLTDAQQEAIRAAGFDVIPLFRLIAQFGREEAHGSFTTKGATQMAGEQLSRDAAKKRFDDLTRQIHDARFKNDHMRVRALDEERSRLADALFPGTTEPQGENRRVVG